MSLNGVKKLLFCIKQNSYAQFVACRHSNERVKITISQPTVLKHAHEEVLLSSLGHQLSNHHYGASKYPWNETNYTFIGRNQPVIHHFTII